MTFAIVFIATPTSIGRCRCRNITYINTAPYLQQLCLSISRSRLEPNNIKLNLAVRPLSIPSDRCWRLGMIVYELITDSARHAFQATEGKVLVELHFYSPKILNKT